MTFRGWLWLGGGSALFVHRSFRATNRIYWAVMGGEWHFTCEKIKKGANRSQSFNGWTHTRYYHFSDGPTVRRDCTQLQDGLKKQFLIFFFDVGG
jgi:hypothetical protein